MEYSLNPKTFVTMTMEPSSRQMATFIPISQMWEGLTTLIGSPESCIW